MKAIIARHACLWILFALGFTFARFVDASEPVDCVSARTLACVQAIDAGTDSECEACEYAAQLVCDRITTR